MQRGAQNSRKNFLKPNFLSMVVTQFMMVGMGGAMGAMMRYGCLQYIPPKSYPVTIGINMAGSFLLGGLTTLPISNNAFLLFGTGLCGGFTTFSTFSMETLHFFQTNQVLKGSKYLIGTNITCIAAAAIGYKVFQVSRYRIKHFTQHSKFYSKFYKH